MVRSSLKESSGGETVIAVDSRFVEQHFIPQSIN